MLELKGHLIDYPVFFCGDENRLRRIERPVGRTRRILRALIRLKVTRFAPRARCNRSKPRKRHNVTGRPHITDIILIESQSRNTESPWTIDAP